MGTGLYCAAGNSGAANTYWQAVTPDVHIRVHQIAIITVGSASAVGVTIADANGVNVPLDAMSISTSAGVGAPLQAGYSRPINMNGLFIGNTASGGSSFSYSILFSVVRRSGDPFFVENFDTAISNGWTDYDLVGSETPDASTNFAYTAAPWGGGDTALEVTIHANDTPSGTPATRDRAELARSPSVLELPHGTPFWAGWDLWIPTDYDYNSSTPAGQFQLIGQWHDNELGLGYEPPIEVAYRQASGTDSSLRIGYGLDAPFGTEVNVTADISRGVRNRLKFHIKESLDSDGYAHVYLNGTLIGSATGPNIYPAQGAVANKFRLGCYRGDDQLQTNTFYLGNLRMSYTDNF